MKFSGIIASALFAFATLNEASPATVRGSATAASTNVQDVSSSTTDDNSADRALRSYDYDYDFSSHPNQGCRTDKGGKGVQGHDYDKFDHLNKHECEQLCDHLGYDCKAFEYGSNSGRCEIWYKDVFRTGDAKGVTCYVKKEYYYNNNHNKVCRTSHGGKGVEGKDYFTYHDNDCASRCDSFGYDCKAYESGPKGHCEIWVYLPPQLESNHGYNCAFKYYY